jgi:sulfite exporter TauE/SafE
LATGYAEHFLADALRVLTYNAGRIGSYALAGALAGGLAAGLASLPGLPKLQWLAYLLSNVLLLALGLYLSGLWPALARVEMLGQQFWRRLQPLNKRLQPVDNWWKTFLLGSLWGWLPCGMVYSNLVIAGLSGSAQSGALAMLAFGTGTLPTLFATGMLGARLRTILQSPHSRMAAGAVVFSFGMLGLWRIVDGSAASWLVRICIARSTW